jgi:sec-independent protein translocase protein TatA
MNLGGTELIIVGIIVVLLFGSRLPKIARSLGQAQQEFKKGQSDTSKSGEAPKSDTPPSA